jgi:hypothetical protein
MFALPNAGSGIPHWFPGSRPLAHPGELAGATSILRFSYEEGWRACQVASTLPNKVMGATILGISGNGMVRGPESPPH